MTTVREELARADARRRAARWAANAIIVGAYVAAFGVGYLLGDLLFSVLR